MQARVFARLRQRQLQGVPQRGVLRLQAPGKDSNAPLLASSAGIAIGYRGVPGCYVACCALDASATPESQGIVPVAGSYTRCIYRLTG